MTVPTPQMLEVGTGSDRRCIACLSDPPRITSSAGLFWLSGYNSDMASTKATVIAEHAHERGLGCTRFDYSGHGQSEGQFTDGTIGRWLDEAYAVFTRATTGPQIVIGSSMGGYIALLLLRRLERDAPADAVRLRSLILIAPAWDMTEELMWKTFSETQRRTLMEEGVLLRPSEYGEPYPITRALIEEGRNHLLAGQPFDPGRPVSILQGLQDPDVPAAHTRKLLQILTGEWAEITEVPDGEHRLSRPQDLDLLRGLIDDLAAAIAEEGSPRVSGR